MNKCPAAISPDDRTGHVARRTLEARLASVRRFMPLAARHADEDVEYVHELRVWARRASAALELFAEFLPRRGAARLEKQMKRLRRAATDARDFDVLAARLGEEHATPEVVAGVRARRRKAQRPLTAACRRLTRKRRFDRRVDKLLRRVRWRGRRSAPRSGPPFGSWARVNLQPFVDRFFDAVPGDWTDTDALHRFRIQGKKLRYAMELLAGAFPAEFRLSLYPIVETLQDKLGDINDWETAQNRLRKRIQRTHDPQEAARLRRLLDDEEARLELARDELVRWLHPAMLETLRTGYEQCLQAGTAAEPATVAAD